MNKLLRDFKKYGWKGLAISLTVVTGIAMPTKSAKAATYCTNGYCDIRMEQTAGDIKTSNVIVPSSTYTNTVIPTATVKATVAAGTPTGTTVVASMDTPSNGTTTNIATVSNSNIIPEATVEPAPSLQRSYLKMYYNDEEMDALGKDKNSCEDNHVVVAPVEQIQSSNTRATNEIVEANPKTQKLSIKNLDGTITTVGVTSNGQTYSSGNSATTSPNGVTTVINNDGTATMYQNVNGTLMKRTIELEGTINHSPAEGQFTAEGEYNLAWEKNLLYPNRETNMGVDGVFENSEGSTVIVTNDGQTVTTIDHSTGSVYSSTCSITTAEGDLARAAYYGVPYYEYMSSKGHYDAGTIIQECCKNGVCTLGSAEECAAYTLR